MYGIFHQVTPIQGEVTTNLIDTEDTESLADEMAFEYANEFAQRTVRFTGLFSIPGGYMVQGNSVHRWLVAELA